MTRRHRGAPPEDARARARREVDEELAFHRAETIAELMGRGLSAQAAEAEARRRFGPESHRDRIVAIDVRRQAGDRRRAAMAVLTTSVRSVLRGATRSPGFTLGVTAILTLGLGVNAITFGLVNRLVLSGPAGIEKPGGLRRVVVHRRGRSGAERVTTELGYLDYEDLLGASQLAGAAGESASPLLFGAGDDAERIQGRLVTANYFSLLGVQPAIGRFFTAAESEREGARVAVLSHAFWQRHFGGDAAAVGQVLPIESHRYVVVGVAPRAFTGSAVTQVDVFMPLEAASDEQVEGPWRTSRNFRWMEALVRLAPGASDAAAAAELTSSYRRAYGGPQGSDSDARVELVPLNALRGATADGQLSVAALVGGVAMLVLLIAFANAANLFLARSLRQRDDVAIRLALGGARWRLIAEQATEGALLAAVGATAAGFVATLGARPVRMLLFPDVYWLDAPLDGRTLLFLAVCAIAGGGLAAALPMWQAGRTDVTRWLRPGGHRVSRTRTQGALLLVQGTLSVLLLVGAGLFVRSLQDAQSLDVGIDTGRLLAVSALRGETAPRADFRAALRNAAANVPGVEGTTVVAGTIPFMSSWAVRLNVPGLENRPVTDDGGPYVAAVEPGYFETVGTSIVEGRPFTPADREGAERVVIVNQTMARMYWPGERAIGKCLEIGPDHPPCTRVIGIVENTRRQTIVEGDSLLYYVPIAQAPDDLRNGRLIVRAASADAGTLARIAETIRREALSIEPGLRYVSVRPLDEIISPQLRAWRLGAGLFSAFGVLALIVAGVGLYSVIVFDVEGRRREIGIRTALGATAPSILRLVVTGGLRLASGGVVLGLGLAWLLAPAVEGLLYGAHPRDSRVFLSVAIVLAGATVLASLVPALKAARIDPVRALRED